jgi:hypothetical protein
MVCACVSPGAVGLINVQGSFEEFGVMTEITRATDDLGWMHVVWRSGLLLLKPDYFVSV